MLCSPFLRCVQAITSIPAAVAFTLAALVGACAEGPARSDEPGVPEARATAGDAGIIRFPVAADGRLDTAGSAVLRFRESERDFGTVAEGELVRHRFPFRNAGEQPLVITHARSTCGCTVPDYPRTPIAPGDTGSVLVVFDTEGKAGPQRKPITLTANTYPNETTIDVYGTVTAAGPTPDGPQ